MPMVRYESERKESTRGDGPKGCAQQHVGRERSERSSRRIRKQPAYHRGARIQACSGVSRKVCTTTLSASPPETHTRVEKVKVGSRVRFHTAGIRNVLETVTAQHR